ncbi:hypothetical protein JCM10908_005674 [Rhodotorula pacifica]|uniref:uncharacterized protein n=1 Tax=Rhodotorula pacifica TaxID=1495444 RepID=UPI003171F0ED
MLDLCSPSPAPAPAPSPSRASEISPGPLVGSSSLRQTPPTSSSYAPSEASTPPPATEKEAWLIRALEEGQQRARREWDEIRSVPWPYKKKRTRSASPTGGRAPIAAVVEAVVCKDAQPVRATRQEVEDDDCIIVEDQTKKVFPLFLRDTGRSGVQQPQVPPPPPAAPEEEAKRPRTRGGKGSYGSKNSSKKPSKRTVRLHRQKAGVVGLWSGVERFLGKGKMPEWPKDGPPPSVLMPVPEALASAIGSDGWIGSGSGTDSGQ